MLVAKEKVLVGSMHVISDLEGKENYLRSLLNNREYDAISENLRSFLELQKTKDVIKYNILLLYHFSFIDSKHINSSYIV